LTGRILLIKPPFFSPLTPPLGLALLKRFTENNGFQTKCADFNVDPVLWATHHQYFRVFEHAGLCLRNEGYSKLWWVLNAHSMAWVNGATLPQRRRVLEHVTPLTGLTFNPELVPQLEKVVENYFGRLAQVVDELDLSHFDWVGVSTYTVSLAASLYILKRAKEAAPGIKTVMGGGIFDDDFATGSENLELLQRNFPFVDHAVLGEGELIFLRLLRGELTNRILTRADCGGATVDLDQPIVPNFDDFDMRHYFHLGIEGSRSCPFQCGFCSETIQWGKFRRKPPHTLADHMLGLSRKHNCRKFFMGDSLMNLYIDDLSSALLARDERIWIDGYLRPDKTVGADATRIAKWARAGLSRVRLGCESGSAAQLKRMNKANTPQHLSDSIRTLAAHGIRTTTYWVCGYPGETEEDFEETLRFVKEHHRSIYELEAHTFWHYPYGQVSSRLFKDRSLYADDVSDILKAKMWEVVDVSPARAQRFERQKRMAKLTTDLGIPNIYDMHDWYKAEARWQALHPPIEPNTV
jgi:radical SAM superfamily enzyme YgiQ (UPF0313 family)